MVPFSAASRENGAGAPRPRAGGSTREKAAPVRRRLERMPMRLEPRLGERPAGAESGDLARFVLSLAAGDLGWRSDRGRAEAVRPGLETGSWMSARDGAEAALVRTKEDGLTEALPEKKLSAPLLRLENRTGSTFSKSSISTRSEALRLLTGEDGEMAEQPL